MSDTNATPKFGTPAYREYFRTDYIEKDGASRFLGISNGTGYMVTVFIILTLVPVALGFLINQYHLYYILLVPVYFLVCNGFEYVLHRYPMHHKVKGLGFLYEHLTVHHSFFYNDTYYYEQPRDYMAVFLPLLYFSFITLVFSAASLTIYVIADLDNALFFALVAYTYYLMYEIMHFSYHARSGSVIKAIPLVEQSAQLHLYHHRIDLMNKYNFNITFPIFDKVFNTLYMEDKEG